MDVQWYLINGIRDHCLRCRIGSVKTSIDGDHLSVCSERYSQERNSFRKKNAQQRSLNTGWRFFSDRSKERAGASPLKESPIIVRVFNPAQEQVLNDITGHHAHMLWRKLTRYFFLRVFDGEERWTLNSWTPGAPENPMTYFLRTYVRTYFWRKIKPNVSFRSHFLSGLPLLHVDGPREWVFGF